MISTTQVTALTVLAMLAFAGNSLLCRMALAHTGIDAASFTSIRLVSGALTLGLIVALRDRAGARPVATAGPAGNWPSAFALFAYAAAFSFAYLSLTAATGALLLFGAVQTTMIGWGLWSGERLRGPQAAGLVVALGGLVGLLLPGLSAPPLLGAGLMLAAGVAWGAYSLRGKSGGKGHAGSDPTRVTAGNFLRSMAFTAVLSLAMLPQASLDSAGMGYAVASGALASGLGYAVWYTALRGLQAASAATVQLSVPVIAALGGTVLLSEPLTLRLLLCSAAILGGIALVIARPQRSEAAKS
ncbi:MAG: DMT family transporter [Burkholderiaceae bacterium]